MKSLFFIFTSVFLFFHGFGQGQFSLYLYRSIDGTTFGEPVFLIDSSDVPSLVRDASGKLFCVFQHFKGRVVGRMAVMTSSDNGRTWTSPLLINPSGLTGSVERKGFDPTITVTPDGKYRLYFSHCPGTLLLDSTCDTYSAISSDGLRFDTEPGVRMDDPTRAVIDPAVLYFNGQWHYTAPVDPQIGGGARHAVSSDGLNFTLIDSIGQVAPGTPNHYKWTGNLMKDNNKMRFYGFGDGVNNNLIWWAESTDGSHWSAYTFTNIQGKDPAVVKLGNNEYLMIVPQDSIVTQDSVIIVNNLLSFESSLKIFPNPVREKLLIESEVPFGHIIVLGLTGKILKEVSIRQARSYVLSLAGLPAGMYFLQVRSGDKVIYGKFVKE